MLGFLLMRILISQYNTMTVVNKMLGFVLMRILITMTVVIMAIVIDMEDDDNHEEEKDVLSAGAFVGWL